jgi:hypothetical protein
MRAATLLATGIVASTLPVLAAPPPGHPGAEQAIDAIGAVTSSTSNADLPHSGVVISATDANSFTYVEVLDDESGKPRWLAVPRQPFAAGDRVRFDEGGLMNNFYSRKLNVTFDSILFVKRIGIVKKSAKDRE